MAEDDGLSRAPVLVVDFCAVIAGDRIHVMGFSVVDVVIFMILLNPFVVFLRHGVPSFFFLY